MSVVYEKVLEILLNILELAFSDCVEDRKILHDIEWEADDKSPSILGEVDVRADTVIGIAKTFLKKKPDNINELIETLEANSVYRSDSIVSWLATNGDNFHEFLSYMAAIENLRISTIAFLKKHS